MWIYLKAIIRNLSGTFIKTSVIVAVFYIVITLLLRWGFQGNTQGPSTQEVVRASRERLYNSFQQPEYQTKQGKQLAAVQKRVYCSVFGALCTNNPQDQEKDFPKSLFGFVSSLITIPFTHPPASGIAYVQQSIHDAGFTSKVYAAEGLGFASLRPFLDIWKAFRNMTYVVLVIIVIAIGFMIMFQYKIDANTVISLENALPRIVIALLAITFSFAIAGFLIDLTYLIILFVFQIFESTGLAGYDSQSLQTHYLTSNLLSFNVLSQSGAPYAGLHGIWIYMRTLVNIFELIPWQLQTILAYALIMITGIVGIRMAGNHIPIITNLFGNFEISGVVLSAKAGNIIGTFIAMLTGAFWGAVVVFGGLLLIVIVGLLLLYFRIIFLLLGAYIQIIIQVMFAPVFLLGEAIPGQNSFANWIKKIFGHLMAFPIVIAFLIAIQVIQTYGFNTGVKGSFSLPLLYGFDTSVLAFIISGAFLFAIPDLTKQIVKNIAGESTVKAGPGLLFGGAAVLGGVMGGLSQIQMLKQITGNRDAKLPGQERVETVLQGMFGKPKPPKSSGHSSGGSSSGGSSSRGGGRSGGSGSTY